MAPTFFPSIMLVDGDSALHSTLSRGESIGLAFRTEAGIFSAIAAVIILILIFRRIRVDSWLAMDIYVIALFVGEFVQGVGHAISMKWVIDGEVNAGTLCTAQGSLLQLGEMGVALATLSIAVQTFVSIWWLKYPNTTLASVFVALQSIFIILLVGIGFGVHTDAPDAYYATPTPYWCWLGRNFKAERIAGEYFWLWLTLFVSIVLYTPLFLLHTGIVTPGNEWYKPTMESAERPRGGPDKQWTAIVYPSVYCLVVLPWSIVRWIGFKQEDTLGKIQTPSEAIFVFAILFTLSGVLNAAVYFLTRISLLWPESQPKPDAPGDASM